MQPISKGVCNVCIYAIYINYLIPIDTGEEKVVKLRGKGDDRRGVRDRQTQIG